MKRPRMSTRNLLLAIAATALLLAAGRLVYSQFLGPRPGFYQGRYWYIDTNWPFYHKFRGAIIYVSPEGFMFAD